jgi:hypothetical protein
MQRAIIAIVVLLVIVLALPSGFEQPASAADSVTGLHVVGNQIRNDANQVVRLRGVNRPSAEYACIQNWGIIYGATDAASIQAMLGWRINVVRLPLNEDCWLDVNMTDVNPAYRGANYRNVIIDYVNRLTQAGIAVILDLHWSAPGMNKATGQVTMPDRDHAPAFWQSVATTFKTNTAVIFDLFNEPYPDNNQDTTAAWLCLRDGSNGPGTCPSVGFQAAGMQELLDTVRATGASNLVMIPGVGYTGLMTRWLQYRPVDPLEPDNIAASTHIYPGWSWCPDVQCWNAQLEPITAQYPLVTGEMGQTSCASNLIDGVIDWMEAEQQHYLAWAWWTEPCGSPAYYGLITSYTTGAPSSGYGQGYRDRLLALAQPASFTTAASATPSTIFAGGTVSITADVTSASDSVAIVDVEVHNAQNQKVFQQYFENQAFSAGLKRTFPVSWPVPSGSPVGSYQVHVGVFSPGWTTQYAWHHNAASVQVISPLPTPTLTPTPAVSCSPRPPVSVQAHADPDGRLRVIVSVSGTGNSLASIGFNTSAQTSGNALIDTPTQTGRVPPFILSPTPPGPGAMTFWVRPANPSLPITLPLTVNDACGAWSTFVGRGA